MIMRGLLQFFLLIGVMLCATESYARERGARRLEIEGIARVTHLSSSGANLYVEVENAMGRRLVVKRGEVDVMVGGSPKITITLRDKVVIPKHYSGEILLPLRFESAGAIRLGAILRRIVQQDDIVTINYRVRAGTTLWRRNFCGESIAISEFFDTFASSKGLIGELEELVR